MNSWLNSPSFKLKNNTFSKKHLLLFILVFAMVGSYFIIKSFASAATHYISPTGNDSNPCSQAAPCLSFNRAYFVASPGDTVMVAGGSYPAQTVLVDPAKETATQRVVFIPSGPVTIQGDLAIGQRNNYSAASLGAKHLEIRDVKANELSVWLGADDVIFRNLDINRHTITSANNIQLLGGDIGPNIDGVSHINACANTKVTPIYYCPGPKNIIIDGVLYHDFLISDPEPHSECIMIWGGGTENVTIRNSTFLRCTDFDVLVKAPGNSKNIVFENNFFDSPMPGDRATTACNPNCPRGGNVIRFSSYNYPDSAIISNTALAGYAVDTADSSFIMRNNIGPRTSCFGLKGTTGYNLWSGITCSPTDKMAALSDILVDVDTLDGTMDLHLKAGAAAIDAGDPVNFPPTDIDGQSRPQGTAPDIGADEYTTGSGGTTPTVSLSASPTSISSGSASNLTWSSTNATSCNASGAWSGTKAISGTQSTGSLTSTSTFTLTCTGTGGSASASATVSINPPASDTVTDDFERATLGGNWTNQGANPGIVNNSDLGILSGSVALVYWTASTLSNDQFSEGTYSLDKNPDMMGGVFVRRRASDLARYQLHYNVETVPQRWEIKYDGVPSTQTKILASNSAVAPPDPGDTIRIQAVGNTITAYWNGNEIMSVDDNSAEKISGGTPGMAFRLKDNPSVSQPEPVFESWSGGSLGGSPTDTTPPTVSLTSPTNGSTVCGSINLSASASDNVGVVGVQFRVGGTNFGAEDTSAPYSIALNTTTIPNGSHGLSAVARDAAGNQTTTPTSMITFNNPCPPTQKQGDLNSDGFVNIIDLSILLSNYGKPATASQGDINGDGNCTILDLSILLSKYGT